MSNRKLKRIIGKKKDILERVCFIKMAYGIELGFVDETDLNDEKLLDGLILTLNQYENQILDYKYVK